MLNIIKQLLIEQNIIEQNDYCDKYFSLLQQNCYRQHLKYKTHQHHVIPKRYQFEEGDVSQELRNYTVYLFVKDHILAHYYLARCSIDVEFRYINELAFTYMTNKKYLSIEEIALVKELPMYQELYEDMCKTRGQKAKGKPYPESAKKYLREINLKREYKKEWVQKMTIAKRNSDYRPSAEWREQHAIDMTDRVTIVRDGVQKLVKKSVVDTFIAEGWKLGSKMKGVAKPDGFGDKVSKSIKGVPKSEKHRKALSLSNKDRISINKDHECKRVLPTELDYYIQSGWKLGRGDAVDYSFARDSERTKKISEQNKGRIHINNGVQSKMIKSEELAEYLNNGWIKGRLKTK